MNSPLIKLTYVTRNKEKIASACNSLSEFGIEVVQAAIDTPEIQAKDSKEVAEFSALFASRELNTTVMKMDVGFYIEALNGFPGPYVRAVNETIPARKILRLLDEQDSRTAYFGDAVCIAHPDGKTKIFELKTNGRISLTESGTNGWTVDQIFIPDGYEKTLADMTDEERLTVWKRNPWHEIADYLHSVDRTSAVYVNATK